MALVSLTLSYYRGGKTVSETDSSRISSVLGYLRVYNGILTTFISFELRFSNFAFSKNVLDTLN